LPFRQPGGRPVADFRNPGYFSKKATMSHHRHHHRSGFQIFLHRDKIRQRWKIIVMLLIGFAVIAFLIRLSLA